MDLRSASASQLIVAATHIEHLIRAADLHEPTIVDLIGREQRIRDELRRRESRLLQRIRWDTLAALANRSASRPAGHPRFGATRARNRSGPAGPGRSED